MAEARTGRAKLCLMLVRALFMMVLLLYILLGLLWLLFRMTA